MSAEATAEVTAAAEHWKACAQKPSSEGIASFADEKLAELQKTFAFFDPGQVGYIAPRALGGVMDGLWGEHEALKDMLKLGDPGHTGEISFDSFCKIMAMTLDGPSSGPSSGASSPRPSSGPSSGASSPRPSSS
jgi:hypothetical protein